MIAPAPGYIVALRGRPPSCGASSRDAILTFASFGVDALVIARWTGVSPIVVRSLVERARDRGVVIRRAVAMFRAVNP